MTIDVHNPTDGWEWIYDSLNRRPGVYRSYAWDGTYTALCPCGTDAVWNAWTSQVLYCTCDG